MRIHSAAAFLVCLCLWIPVAKSQNSAFAPEDEDASGDSEEFSGSGSGDDGLEDFEMTTQASTKTTKTAWVTDASVRLQDHTTTQLPSLLVSKAQTSHPITKASPLYTTTVPEAPPSLTSGKAVIPHKEEFGAETTTSRHEENRSVPAERLPQLPVTTERWTTTSPIEETEEETTKLVMLVTNKEDPMVLSEDADWSTDAPELEGTASPLTTTGVSDPADGEASGDTAESTVVPTYEVSLIEEHVIPEVKAEVEKAKPNDGDFDFESDIKPKAKLDRPLSESALGSSSENENLLQKKEVLAGVVAGGVVGLAFAVMLVSLMVYRMKKKDEGSYALDEHQHPNGGYCKPQRQEEFLA